MQGTTALLYALGFLAFTSRFHEAAAATPSFLQQGFFFDYNPPGTTIPIPITQQCDILHITWERGAASGPNPTAPYFLQIYTSTFIVPFVIPAGDTTSTSYVRTLCVTVVPRRLTPPQDFPVPWNPGTQYQVCMFDSNGVTGGCQGIYTIIPNPNATAENPPVCRNLTYPAGAMDVDAEVVGGPISQYGWIPQCTDIQVQAKNGTPPYTFTIAPTLHPPLNITSDGSSPINWTVSLSHGFPFFISLVDSQGNGWAQGPLHSGDGSDTSCLDINHSAARKSSHTAVTAGAAIGGVAVGLLLGALGISAFRRSRPGRSRTHPKIREDFTYDHEFGNGSVGLLDSAHRPGSLREASASSRATHLTPGGLEYIVEPFSMPTAGDPVTVPLLPAASVSGHLGSLPGESNSASAAGSGSSAPTDMSSSAGETQTRRTNVYVVHHDGGRAPVTVYTEEGADVVELPPRYADSGAPLRPDGGDPPRPQDRRRDGGPAPRKARGPRPSGTGRTDGT
ncbi:hypothetical protein BC834DRAFT_450621 [Gloeopeniophorella convolvens]|nr:hypothetical protein BC834DRAFT_450621 [Gloeopeniophorella convolvens]